MSNCAAWRTRLASGGGDPADAGGPPGSGSFGFDFEFVRLERLPEFLLAVLIEVDEAGGDFSQGVNRGLVARFKESRRSGVFAKLSTPSGCQHHERKPVFDLFEAIFDGHAGHGCSSWSRIDID